MDVLREVVGRTSKHDVFNKSDADERPLRQIVEDRFCPFKIRARGSNPKRVTNIYSEAARDEMLAAETVWPFGVSFAKVDDESCIEFRPDIR